MTVGHNSPVPVEGLDGDFQDLDWSSKRQIQAPQSRIQKQLMYSQGTWNLRPRLQYTTASIWLSGPGFEDLDIWFSGPGFQDLDKRTLGFSTSTDGRTHATSCGKTGSAGELKCRIVVLDRRTDQCASPGVPGRARSAGLAHSSSVTDVVNLYIRCRIRNMKNVKVCKFILCHVKQSKCKKYIYIYIILWGLIKQCKCKYIYNYMILCGNIKQYKYKTM
jgi:hypothetical protein